MRVLSGLIQPVFVSVFIFYTVYPPTSVHEAVLRLRNLEMSVSLWWLLLEERRKPETNWLGLWFVTAGGP